MEKMNNSCLENWVEDYRRQGIERVKGLQLENRSIQLKILYKLRNIPIGKTGPILAWMDYLMSQWLGQG